LVFLGVAAFLIRLVLGRLVALQRPEIATLKAVGYTNREVGRHYLGLVAVVLVPGALLGALGGRVLGGLVLGLYAAVFRFPTLEFRLSLSLVGWALVASLLSAGGGALLAVRAAVKLPPAEAMRAPAPARYRRGLLERLGVSALLGPSGMMVFREAFRRPLRTSMSALGIGGAVSLLILGLFGWDSMTSYFERTFRREQRQDLMVGFAHPVSPGVIGELSRFSGVVTAEGVRRVPVRVSHEHRKRDTVLMGMPAGGTLRRLVELGGREVPLPEQGVLVTRKLGQILGLRVGDAVVLEVREGERSVLRPTVVGFVDETAGLQVYGATSLVAALTGDLGATSAVLLRVDPREANAIKQRLQRSPHVIEVADVKEDMQRIFDMNSAAFNVWTLVSVLLASSVIFGVVYNNARIALTARSRDLASLRVLGFTRKEISLVLIGSLAVEVAIAIPLGLGLGYAWAQQFASTFDQETFRMAVVIAPRTYLLATTIALVAASASALWVRRDLDRLDLVGVLKTRE
jgi:putative ABC transport system permease protein